MRYVEKIYHRYQKVFEGSKGKIRSLQWAEAGGLVWDGIVSAIPKLGKRVPEPSHSKLGFVSINKVFRLFVRVVPTGRDLRI
jgi:hypothetical protein